MKTSEKQSESISEMKRQRTASRNAIVVMTLLFVALLTGSGATSSPTGELSTGDMVWGGLSIIAFASLLWSLYISYRQADERQRLIQLKATSLTFVAIIFSMVAAQILHALAIVKLDVTIQIVVIGGIVLWMTLVKAVERRSN